MILLIAALVVTQTIELYHARFRPAAELVPIARSALGADGQVTLDARTATLVLNGSPQAVGRALALLERLDRPLAEIVLDVTIRETTDVDSLGVRVVWATTLGPVRIGSLPLGEDGLRVGVDATASSETRTAGSRLRLMEGGTGVIRTGTALPVLFGTYWSQATEFVPVDTGFEATARMLEGDRVHLELRPFAGRIGERGELNYIAASTSVTVTPGETVVLAEVPEQATSTSTDLTGVDREQARRHQVVLVSVELVR